MKRCLVGHPIKHLFYGSSVKCVDTFRIAFTDESKVFIEQKEGYDSLSRLLYLSYDTENLFF